MTNKPTLNARRSFMRSAAGAAATGIAAPTALNLAAMSTASAADATDYKALVCVFLYGANDQYNTLVPYDSANYNQYAQFRQSLAVPHSSLTNTMLSTSQTLPGGKQYALAPQMTQLSQIWQEQNMGVLLNVGPLVVPTSKAQFEQQSVPLPPKLFSHNDQASVWQSLAAEGATTGWGGRMADLFESANTNSLFTSISLFGNAVYLSGERALQYQMTASGPVTLNGRSYDVYRHPAMSQMIEQMVVSNNIGHQMAEIQAQVARRSIDANETLSAALATTGAFITPQNDTPLGNQLETVARMIKVRDQLGMKRQVFFVGMNGFDHHDGLSVKHPQLMAELDAALSTFYRTTQEMGVADKVTSFTASDFGRTLTGNGDGTDHGWGSHHFVVGGAVQGQQYWGQAPELGDNGPDDVGRGRLLPTTAVEQYTASLGRWFGVSESELNDIFPRLKDFDSQDMGILGA